MAIPIFLFFMSTNILESETPICLIRNFFGFECLGCGMTRALSCILKGQFEMGFHYNKLVVIVFPLLAYIWAKNVLKAYQRLRADIQKTSKRI